MVSSIPTPGYLSDSVSWVLATPMCWVCNYTYPLAWAHHLLFFWAGGLKQPLNSFCYTLLRLHKPFLLAALYRLVASLLLGKLREMTSLQSEIDSSWMRFRSCRARWKQSNMIFYFMATSWRSTDSKWAPYSKEDQPRFHCHMGEHTFYVISTQMYLTWFSIAFWPPIFEIVGFTSSYLIWGTFMISSR